jgi:osmotically-inducible protein OsmY
MRRSFLIIFLPLILFVGGFAAPAQAGTVSRTATAGRVATPTDAQLDATIRAKLAKSKIGKDGFHFKVARGIVTWEGNTNVVQHKGAATRMAKSAGAVQVVNNIQISGDAKAKAAAHLKKASLTQ